MKPERYQQIRDVFHGACEQPPAAREVWLDEACAGDAELREEVESLLAHHEQPDTVFEETSLGFGRALVEGGGAASTAASPDPETTEEEVPDAIGPYRIVSKIGEGGMGTVYLAEQDHPRRRVALKMIRPAFISQSLLRRFKFEADVLGRLQHPGIAQIHEAGEIDTGAGRQPYFAMEYVDGVELKRYADEHELDTRAKLELVARICDAVHHAHQKGVIHRDLKPENVLVVDGSDSTASGKPGDSEGFANIGRPKVLDFGVARITDCDIQMTTLQTDVAQFIGTIPYMSPEQVVGDSRALDTRSDVYALGVMLFELLCDRLPFDLRTKSIPEAARIIREDDPARLSSINTIFRGDIETVVLKALEKDRDRRYQSAAELAADIRRYLANEPLTAHPPSTFYQFRKFAKRNKGLVAGLALSFVIMVGGTIVSLIYASIAQQRQTLAEKNEDRALLGEAAAQRAASRANLAAAQAVGRTDARLALKYLNDVPEAHRNWEWRHLHSVVDPEIASYKGRSQTAGLSSDVIRLLDGRLIAAVVHDHRIELIDLESGDVQAAIECKEPVATPRLSPDGSCLAAVAPETETLKVWDVDTHRQLLELPTGTISVDKIRFSYDGSLIALPSSTNGLSLVEVATDRELLTAIPHGNADVTAVAFDPVSPRFAITEYREDSSDIVSVFSLTGDPTVSKAAKGDVASLTFSPDGSHLAIGYKFQKIRILESTTLGEREKLASDEKITALAYSPDSTHLAGSHPPGKGIRIWELARPGAYRDLPGGGATSLAFDQSSTLLATAAAAGVTLWELMHQAPLVLRNHQDYVYLVTYSPDGTMIASSSWDNTVRLWDAVTGESLAVLSREGAEWWPALSFTADGSRLLANDGKARPVQWDTASGLRIPASEHSDGITADAVSSSDLSWHRTHLKAARGGARVVVSDLRANSVTSEDGSLFAEFSIFGSLMIAELDSGHEVLRINEPETSFLAGTFNPNGDRFITGSKEGAITIWDVSSGARIADMSADAGAVYALAYSPDSTRIASGGRDGNIIIWDANSFEQVITLSGHESYVYSLLFSPDGTQLVSGSGDGTVRIWDSVPLAERHKQAQAAATLREEVAPLVDQLLQEFGEPLIVADYLRADDSLDEPSRRAAIRVLLLRSQTDN